MDPTRWTRLGLGLLAPGALVFAGRAALAAGGADPAGVPGAGPVTAAGGVLSLVGLLVLVAGRWPTPQRGLALLAATVAFAAHFALGRVAEDAASAFVYLATGIAASLARRRFVWPGAVAAVGAVVRMDAPRTGSALVALGSLVLGLVLLAASLGVRPRTARSSAAPPGDTRG